MGRGGLPSVEEIRDRGALHPAHRFELALLLAVKELAVAVQDRQSRHTSRQRNAVARGDVDIGIHMPDVDVNQDVVGFEQNAVRCVMKEIIEHMAVGAPISTEIKNDAFMRDRRGFQRNLDLRRRLRRIGINVGQSRARRVSRENENADESRERGALALHVGEHSAKHRAVQPAATCEASNALKTSRQLNMPTGWNSPLTMGMQEIRCSRNSCMASLSEACGGNVTGFRLMI